MVRQTRAVLSGAEKWILGARRVNLVERKVDDVVVVAVVVAPEEKDGMKSFRSQHNNVVLFLVPNAKGAFPPSLYQLETPAHKFHVFQTVCPGAFENRVRRAKLRPSTDRTPPCSITVHLS